MKKLIYILSALIFLGCEKQNIENSDESLQKCNITLTESFNLGKLQFSIFTEYDSEKNIAKYQVIDPDKSIRNIVSYTNEYDNEKNLIKVVTLRKDNTVFSTETNTYYSKGKIKTKNIDYSSNIYERNVYDINGKIISHVNNSDGKILERTTSYLAKDLISEEVLKIDNKVSNTTKNTYNSDLKLIKKEIINGSITHISEMFYDEKGNFTKITNNKGQEVLYTHTATTTTYIIKRSGKYIESYREEFDANGKIIKKYQSINGTDYVLMNEYTYFPNKMLNTENQYYFKNNSKTESSLIVETKYNETGLTTSRRTFDSQGNIIDEIKNTIMCD